MQGTVPITFKIMRKLSIILLLFLTTGITYSQKSYLGFNLGSSISKGDFAGTEYLFTDGYALPGFTVQFDGMYYPISFVGVGGIIGFGSLYGDRDNYLQNLIDYSYTESEIPLFGSAPERSEVDFESGFWNYVNLMVGPELSVPFGRFQFGVKGMGGMALSFYPKREMSYNTGIGQLKASVKGPGLSLGYLYGASLIYRGRSGTGIKLTADYTHSTAPYDFELTLDSDFESFSDIREETVNVEHLNLMIGIFYLF